MPIVGLKISPNGRCETVKLSTLKDYQDAVEGRIESVPIWDPSDEKRLWAYVNEEGLMLRLHRNFVAEYVLRQLNVFHKDDNLSCLFGNVLLLGPLTKNGKHKSLSADIISAIRSLTYADLNFGDTDNNK